MIQGSTPEPPKRERGLDTAPVDWSAVIDQRIIAEREYIRDLLTEIVAEVNAQYRECLERTTRRFAAEIADLKVTLADFRATLAELRIAMAADKTQSLELPPLPPRLRSVN